LIERLEFMSPRITTGWPLFLSLIRAMICFAWVIRTLFSLVDAPPGSRWVATAKTFLPLLLSFRIAHTA